MSVRRLALAALPCAALVLAFAGSRPLAQTRAPVGTVAIRNATILTVTRGTIQNGTIVLRGGKIAAVGASVPIPAGADVVDGTGTFVSPGLIDCHSHIAADEINEGGTTVSSMAGIEDVFNPTDVDIYRDLAGGLTTANVLHGSANPIGGRNQVIKLRWGKTRTEDFVFEGAMPGIKFALGENPKRPGGGAGGRFGNGPARYPGTRMGVEYVVRDAFVRAKAYQKEWQDYDRRRKAGEDPLAPRRDLQLEPLVEVLEGKRLVHAHSYRADEILMLMRVADEFGFKIATFQHVLEGYKVAKEIAAHGAGASTFSDWWGYKIEAADAIPYNAAIMTRKGVVVSINSDSAEHARRLNTEAAKSIKWGGLSDDEAFAMVTINPAKQLRIDNRVGSLEVGKDADVVVWNHHPLSSYATVNRVYIDGQKYYDRIDDQKRIAELQKEKEALVAAEKSERKGPTTTENQTPRGDRGPGGPAAADEEPGVARSLQAGEGGANGGRSAEAFALHTQEALPIRTPTKGVLAITNAKIFPIAQPPIDRGTIVVRDGIVAAVGAAVSVPTGAQIIDAAGAEVYPGLIDAESAVGLADPGPGGFSDLNEILDFNPQLRPQVAFHIEADTIPVARANGITTVGVIPTGGILGGQVAVMNLDGWTWEESLVRPAAGVALQFPTMGGGRGGFGGGRGGPERTYEDLKKERDARLAKLSSLLDDARSYAKAPEASRQRNLQLESLVPVVEKRSPFFVRANTEQDIRDAVAFCDKTGVRMVLVGGREAALAAPLLKDKNVPVILAGVLELPTREDLPHQAPYAAAGELVKAGVRIAFAGGGGDPGDDADNVRLLPYNAAMSVAWGLSRDEALKALTMNAAEILGVADRLGSIEPGKIANLFIANGDPMEIRTSVTHVVIAGRDVPLDNKQLALFERYSKRQ
jgi:imidazolonepropionase-like amidohydrolase